MKPYKYVTSYVVVIAVMLFQGCSRRAVIPRVVPAQGLVVSSYENHDTYYPLPLYPGAEVLSVRIDKGSSFGSPVDRLLIQMKSEDPALSVVKFYRQELSALGQFKERFSTRYGNTWVLTYGRRYVRIVVVIQQRQQTLITAGVGMKGDGE